MTWEGLFSWYFKLIRLDSFQGPYGAVTVTSLGGEANPPKTAVSPVVPAATAVSNPAASMVAVPVVPEAQIAVVVTS